MTAAHVVLPGDEARHTPDGEELWNESYYCDFVHADGSLGGWLRLGLYPNRRVAWWTAWIVRPGQPGISLGQLRDAGPPGGRPRQRERGRRAASRSTCAARSRSSAWPPRTSWARSSPTPRTPTATPTGSRSPARRRPDLDDRRRPVPLRPHDPLRDPLPRHRHRDDRRRDLRRRRAGPAGPLLGRARLVGLRMVLVLHAPRRRHPGPPRRHPHAPRRARLLRIHPDTGRGPPRSPRSPSPRTSATTGSRPRPASRSPPEPGHDLGLDVTPVAFGPVLLRNDDGRTSRFPRAMVRCRADDGRIGIGLDRVEPARAGCRRLRRWLEPPPASRLRRLARARSDPATLFRVAGHRGILPLTLRAPDRPAGATPAARRPPRRRRARAGRRRRTRPREAIAGCRHPPSRRRRPPPRHATTTTTPTTTRPPRRAGRTAGSSRRSAPSRRSAACASTGRSRRARA